MSWNEDKNRAMKGTYADTPWTLVGRGPRVCGQLASALDWRGVWKAAQDWGGQAELHAEAAMAVY